MTPSAAFVATGALDDGRVRLWHQVLRLVPALNVSLWWAAWWLSSPHGTYESWQLVLSALFVAGCGFRSIFPVVYVKRFTLSEHWSSSVMLNRTVATVAEIAFAWQLQLVMAEWAARVQVDGVRQAGYVVVACLTVAQLCCWFGVSTGRYVGELVEESLWTVGIAVAFAGALVVAWHQPSRPDVSVLIGLVGSGGFVAFMLLHNLPMYMRRIRATASQPARSVAKGLRDMAVRQEVSYRWSDWAGEAAWLTPYFSVGVWLSLSMIFSPRL